MTRETKVGIAVASSLLCLVGFVIVKQMFGDSVSRSDSPTEVLQVQADTPPSPQPDTTQGGQAQPAKNALVAVQPIVPGPGGANTPLAIRSGPDFAGGPAAPGVIPAAMREVEPIGGEPAPRPGPYPSAAPLPPVDPLAAPLAGNSGIPGQLPARVPATASAGPGGQENVAPGSPIGLPAPQGQIGGIEDGRQKQALLEDAINRHLPSARAVVQGPTAPPPPDRPAPAAPVATPDPVPSAFPVVPAAAPLPAGPVTLPAGNPAGPAAAANTAVAALPGGPTAAPTAPSSAPGAAPTNPLPVSAPGPVTPPVPAAPVTAAAPAPGLPDLPAPVPAGSVALQPNRPITLPVPPPPSADPRAGQMGVGPAANPANADQPVAVAPAPVAPVPALPGPSPTVLPQNQGIAVPVAPVTPQPQVVAANRSDAVVPSPGAPSPLESSQTRPTPTPVQTPTAPVAPGNPVVRDYVSQSFHCTPETPTFEAISRKFYLNERYAKALLRFNRSMRDDDALQREPPVLRVGQIVLVPPIEVLESRYPAEIQDYRPASALAPTGPVSAGPPASFAPAVPAAVVPAAPGALAAFVAAPTPVAGPGPAPGAAGPTKLYQVARGGEAMWDIARRTLGAGPRWVEIYHLNPQIQQPELPIPEGTTLRLPATARVDQ